MERKSFPFELEEKGLDPEARTFQGFAAVMGNVDEGNDVIVKGAFKKTISEMGERVKVFFIHDFMQPIGKVLDLREVPKGKLPQSVLSRAPDATGGLYVKGYISPTTKGNDALALMRDTVLDELSIGYDSVQEEMKEAEEGEKPVRLLREIKLYDISPVPLAMNPAAMITSVKKWIDSLEEQAPESFPSLSSSVTRIDVKLVSIDELPEWDQEKPYPNEHACRLKDPGQYDTCRRGSRESGGKTYHVIYCKKTGGKMEEQAYRYPKDTWSASEAGAHCKKHGGSFEAAAKDVEEEVRQKVIDAMTQAAEIQRQQIEEL